MAVASPRVSPLPFADAPAARRRRKDAASHADVNSAVQLQRGEKNYFLVLLCSRQELPLFFFFSLPFFLLRLIFQQRWVVGSWGVQGMLSFGVSGRAQMADGISEGSGFVGKMGAAPRGALPALPLLGRGWVQPIPALQLLGHEATVGSSVSLQSLCSLSKPWREQNEEKIPGSIEMYVWLGHPQERAHSHSSKPPLSP